MFSNPHTKNKSEPEQAMCRNGGEWWEEQHGKVKRTLLVVVLGGTELEVVGPSADIEPLA
jgi:hypothetical protein